MPRASRMTLAAATAAVLAFAAPAHAADGDLDPSFGGDGIADVGRDSERTLTALQPDGKIVVAGQTPGGDSGTYVARFLPGGELDTGFGGDGYVTLADPDNARGVTVQPDGRIVFTGGINNDVPGDVVVVRLLGDGSPDTSFSGDGVARFDFAGAVDSEPVAVAIDMNGRVVVAGTGPTDNDFEVARLDASGSLDETFSSDGLVSHDLGGDRESPAAVAFQGSRIVVGGTTNLERSNDTDSMHFAALALTAAGERDSSFGGEDGLTTAQLGSSSRVNDTIRTQDGGLLLVGTATTPADGGGTRDRWALLKLVASGQPDAAFGPGGAQLPDLGPETGAAWSAVTTADGRLAVGGSHAGHAAIVKRTLGGAPVTPFGDGGQRIYPQLSGVPQDIVRQADGKLVFGFSHENISSRLARVHDSGSDPAPGDPQAPGESPAPQARLPLLELTAGSAVEGQVLPFTATLSRPSDKPVTFSYFTGEGTAANDRDFGARSGSVTIPAGQTSVTIGVPTNADRLFETEEMFRVELHSAQNARFGEYVAFGTIFNELRRGRCQNVVRGRGKGTDILTGSSAGDLIEGLQDIDFLFGLGGDDCLRGHRGGDIMDGGDGDDVVDGGSGNDRMKGGDGNDRLLGRRGRNRYNGGPGNDTIHARNGVAEIVECGPGRDRVTADRRDRLRRCERVSR